MVFGHELLRWRPEDCRAVLNHNRDIGLLAHDRLVVLGLMQTVEFYTGAPKIVDMNLLAQPTASELDLEKDAIALFQVADDLYMHQRYRLDPKPTSAPPTPALANSKYAMKREK